MHQKQIANMIKKYAATGLFCLFFTFNSWSHASPTILVLGDSLSAEYGLARGSGWVGLLNQEIQNKEVLGLYLTLALAEKLALVVLQDSPPS
jgi:lysophospholipase L1-like esterase